MSSGRNIKCACTSTSILFIDRRTFKTPLINYEIEPETLKRLTNNLNSKFKILKLILRLIGNGSSRQLMPLAYQRGIKFSIFFGQQDQLSKNKELLFFSFKNPINRIFRKKQALHLHFKFIWRLDWLKTQLSSLKSYFAYFIMGSLDKLDPSGHIRVKRRRASHICIASLPFSFG